MDMKRILHDIRLVLRVNGYSQDDMLKRFGFHFRGRLNINRIKQVCMALGVPYEDLGVHEDIIRHLYGEYVLPEVLQDIRASRGQTYQEMAEDIGVSYVSLYTWARGTGCRPDASSLKMLAEWLSMDPIEMAYRRKA